MAEKRKSSSKQSREKSGLRKSSKHSDRRLNESRKSMSKKRSLLKKTQSKKSRGKSRKGYLCFPFSLIDTFFPTKEDSRCSASSFTKSSKSSSGTVSTRKIQKRASSSLTNKSKKKVSSQIDKSVEVKETPVEQKTVEPSINIENYMKFTGLLSTLPFSSFLGSNLMSVDDIKNLLKKRPDLQEQLRQILGDKLQTPTLKPIKDLLDELSEEGKPKTENEKPIQKSSLKKEPSVLATSRIENTKKSVTISTKEKNIKSPHSKVSIKKASSKNIKSVEAKSIFRQLCDKIFFKGPEIEKKKQSTSHLSILDCSFISQNANQELKSRYREWLRLSPKNQKRCTFEEYVKIMVYVDELKKNCSSESKKERRRIKAWLASLGHETTERSSQTDASISDISRPSFFDTDDLVTDLLTPSIGSICKPSFLSLTKDKPKKKMDGDCVMVRLKTLADELAELKEMSRVDQNIRTEDKPAEKLKENPPGKSNDNERPIVGGLTFSEKNLSEGDGPEPCIPLISQGKSTDDSITMNQVKELCFGLLNQISLHGSRPSTDRNPRPSIEPVQLFHMQTELQYDPQSEAKPCFHHSKLNIRRSKSSSTEDNSDQLENLVLYNQSKNSTSLINSKHSEPRNSLNREKKTKDKTVMKQVINLAKEKDLVFHYADSGFNSNGSKEQEAEQQGEVESSDESVGGEAVAVVSQTGMLNEEGLQRALSDPELFQETEWEADLEMPLGKASSDPGLCEEEEVLWLEVDTGPFPDGPRRCRSGLPPRVLAPPPGVRSAPHLLWPSSCDDLSSQLSHSSDSELSSRTSSLSETRPSSSPCLASISATNLPAYYESSHKPSKSSKLKNLLGKLKK